MTRHTELQKIEKAIIEVRDLFVRISTLVMEQSDKINRIEDFATKTSAKVEKAEGQIDKARKLRIKAIKVRVSRRRRILQMKGLMISLPSFVEKDVALDMDYRDFISYHLDNGHFLVHCGPTADSTRDKRM